MIVTRSLAMSMFLAGVVMFAMIGAIPTPQSTELVTVDYSVALVERFPSRPYWTIRTEQMNAFVVAGTCIAGGCGAAINTVAGGVVEIFVGVIYGILSFGNNYGPIDAARNAGTGVRRGLLDLDPAVLLEYTKFLNLVDELGGNNDIDELISFGSGRSNIATLNTAQGSILAERKQVVHPVKRDMRSVIRLRTQPRPNGKRQTTYGIEAYYQEAKEDYEYPPDRGWVQETGGTIGNEIYYDTLDSNSGDVCVKMVNYLGNTAYTYMKYDGTEDNEQYDQVFGCENEEYPPE